MNPTSKPIKRPNLFLLEAPRGYLPYPPKGWFALRSRTRRVFLQLDNGRYPHPEEMNRRLTAGEFQEVEFRP